MNRFLNNMAWGWVTGSLMTAGLISITGGNPGIGLLMAGTGTAVIAWTQLGLQRATK